ncbi:MAG: phasin family protein, partial [Motiliproteus sp.]
MYESFFKEIESSLKPALDIAEINRKALEKLAAVQSNCLSECIEASVKQFQALTKATDPQAAAELQVKFFQDFEAKLANSAGQNVATLTDASDELKVILTNASEELKATLEKSFEELSNFSPVKLEELSKLNLDELAKLNPMAELFSKAVEAATPAQPAAKAAPAEKAPVQRAVVKPAVKAAAKPAAVKPAVKAAA